MSDGEPSANEPSANEPNNDKPNNDKPSKDLAPPPRLLISDADRGRIADVVGQAYAEGRLTREEYDERLNTAMAARTVADLIPALEGLPPQATAAALAPLVGALAPTAAPALARIAQTDGSPAGWYPPAGAEASSNALVAVFGGTTRKGQWVVPAQMTAFALFGGVEIDMTSASFAADSAEMTAVAVFGGVQITVPHGMAVHVDGIGIFGGFDQQAEGPGDAGAPTLRVKGAAVFGGVEVRRRPRLGPVPDRNGPDRNWIGPRGGPSAGSAGGPAVGPTPGSPAIGPAPQE